MKFICLGYGEEKSWDAKSASERDAAIEECFHIRRRAAEGWSLAGWRPGTSRISDRQDLAVRERQGGCH